MSENTIDMFRRGVVRLILTDLIRAGYYIQIDGCSSGLPLVGTTRDVNVCMVGMFQLYYERICAVNEKGELEGRVILDYTIHNFVEYIEPTLTTNLYNVRKMLGMVK
jgi:hypothetical protein